MYNDPYDTNQMNNTNDPLHQNKENEGKRPSGSLHPVLCGVSLHSGPGKGTCP